MTPGKQKTIAFLTAAVAGGLVAFLLLRPESAEDRIRRRFDDFAAVLEKHAGEHAARSALKNEQLHAFFADEVVIEGRIPFVSGRHTASELSATISQLRLQAESVSVHFDEVQVTVTSDDHARASFHVRVSGRGKGDRGSDRRERHMSAVLVRIDGKWRFEQFAVIPDNDEEDDG